MSPGDVIENVVLVFLVALALLAGGVLIYLTRVVPLKRRWDKMLGKKPYEFRDD
jgi:type II secretory pathway component PulF